MYHRLFLFICFKDDALTTTGLPLLYATPHWLRHTTRGHAPEGAARTGRHVSSPVTSESRLWGAPRNPRFLVSHLLVRFPHRKHVNDLSIGSPAAARRLLTRRQKNRSTRNWVLVSRKAMQNYTDFPTWQNIFRKKLKKTPFLTSFH